MRIRIAAVTCLVVVVASAAFLWSSGEPGCAPGGGSLSAYEWRSAVWDSPETAADLIATAERLCLAHVYVDVTGLAVEDQRDGVERSLGVLLDLAAESPVQVGALAGDPWWSSPEGVADATIVLEGLVRVNEERMNPIESFHLDVEPWGLDEWSDRKPMLVLSYLEFVSHIVATRDKLASPPIHLSFLIPYWFDGSNGEAPQVEVDTVVAYPFQHLQARDFDEVTWIVMAYRDRVEGDGGVLDLLSEELVLSESVGLALETAPVEPSSITFADETVIDLDRELATLLATDLGLDEIVINDLEHLQVLADRQAVQDTAPSG